MANDSSNDFFSKAINRGRKATQANIPRLWLENESDNKEADKTDRIATLILHNTSYTFSLNRKGMGHYGQL